MTQNSLLKTERAFARAARQWRTQVGRSFDTDGVLRSPAANLL